MKHFLSVRKRFLAFVFAAALVLCAAVPVLAGSGNLDGPYTNNKQTIEVTATCESPVYRVTIDWNSMKFSYQYGKGWDYTSVPDFNAITVTNYSFVPVAVKMDFEGNDGYTATFHEKQAGVGESYQALYLSEATQETFPKGTVYLILNEKQPSNPNDQIIGHVTLTLSEVIHDNAAALTAEYGSTNIGYVTQASELVPFSEKDIS